MERHRSLALVAALPFLAIGACRSPGSRPDDMSAEEHRATARAHEVQAKESEKKYDRRAKSVAPTGPVGGGKLDALGVGRWQVYNPTARHLAEAEKHRDYAAQHLRAAEALERYEDGECGEFTPEVRASCPLLNQVTTVVEIDGGARVAIADGIPIDAVLAHVRCHLAFARTHDHQGMDQCPLYLEEVHVEWLMHSRVIDILSDDRSVRTQIRALARAHLAPVAAASDDDP